MDFSSPAPKLTSLVSTFRSSTENSIGIPCSPEAPLFLIRTWNLDSLNVSRYSSEQERSVTVRFSRLPSLTFTTKTVAFSPRPSSRDGSDEVLPSQSPRWQSVTKKISQFSRGDLVRNSSIVLTVARMSKVDPDASTRRIISLTRARSTLWVRARAEAPSGQRRSAAIEPVSARARISAAFSLARSRRVRAPTLKDML